jgi:hypothetical protein
MSKVFVEYQILPQHRSVYSQWVQIVKDKCPELELLEGVDQPGLYIEVWDGCSREAYEWMKKIRKSDVGLSPDDGGHTAALKEIDWSKLDEWVQGGASKINIWYFKKVR